MLLKKIKSKAIENEKAIISLNEYKTELEKLNSVLSEKNTQLEQIIYVTSHDLRSPLVNIVGFTNEINSSIEELKKFIDKNNEAFKIKSVSLEIIEKDLKQYLSYIYTSTKKMEVLLNGLLKLSRTGTVPMVYAKIDTQKLVTDVIETYEYLIKQNDIDLKIKALPECYGDMAMINQLFSNLISNAIKYLDYNRKGIIEISGKASGDNIIFSICDNGIGISQDNLTKIFDVFYRVGVNQKGEGIGLAIVNKIIERHKGKIWVESNSDSGSKFHFSLPIK